MIGNKPKIVNLLGQRKIHVIRFPFKFEQNLH